MDLNIHYRAPLHLRHPFRPHFMSGEEVPMTARYAAIGREKASHKGIGKRTALRELTANAVNQDMLEEIACLTGLEYLELG